MKSITSVCALSFLLITSCGQSSKEDQQKDNQQVESDAATQISDVPSGEPITLHARLDFVDTFASASINANRKLNASIYIETDVMREGSGVSATYSVDSDESRVQGALLASGSLALRSDGMVSNETYNMHNEWNSLTPKPEGKFTIEFPTASSVGEGLSVGVEIEVPVSGTKKAIMTSGGQDVDAEIVHARPSFCASQTADKEVCTLKFTIDAVPTKAQAPEYESLFENAKTIYSYQGKIYPNGGMIMFSGLTPVYGATTHYHDGHFVTALDQQYKVTLKDADIGQHIHLVVWSTKRGDKWQPESLPPLQKPEALQ